MKKYITKILEILEKHYGGASTALTYKTPFQLLISTMLAAQSTDVRVNIVTKDLFRLYPNPEDFARLTTDELEDHIRTVGLYKTKAKNIIAASRMLADEFDGKVPADRDALQQLPGVGRKTANVVLSIAGKVPAIAVDTHVFRVSNRMGLANANNVLETENQLMDNIPREKWSDAHHWLIWHGRKICKARKPLCSACPVVDHCRYDQKNL